MSQIQPDPNGPLHENKPLDTPKKTGGSGEGDKVGQAANKWKSASPQKKSDSKELSIGADRKIEWKKGEKPNKSNSPSQKKTGDLAKMTFKTCTEKRKEGNERAQKTKDGRA